MSKNGFQDIKFLCEKICKFISRETFMSIHYEIIDDGYVEFTFLATTYGELCFTVHENTIRKMGEESFKQHLRELRRGIIDAEQRTSRKLWGSE